jgi:hypothetical protein
MKIFKKNKRKIVALATISGLLGLSLLYVYAGTTTIDNNNIPQLTTYQSNNHVKTEWSADVLDTDTIYKSDFESGQLIPNFNYGWSGYYSDGGQSVTTEDKISGTNSIKVYDTIHNGNWRNYPQTYSDQSLMTWGTLKFSNGTPLSVTFYAKTNNTALINPFGDGGWATSISNIGSITIAQNAPSGQNQIRLNSISGLSVGQIITSDTDPNNIIAMYTITAIDNINNIITINSNLNRTISVGEPLRTRPWRGAFNFNQRTVNASDGWKRFSINTIVSNNADYDVGTRGGLFYISSKTTGTLYIDNVKFGYATQATLYRDGTQIYQGYLSDYDDTSAIDKASPGQVSGISFTGSLGSVKATFSPAQDNGTTYNYQIQGNSVNGTTPLSANNPVTVTSGIKGYSYVIDKNPSTEPDNVMDTTSTAINASINEGGKHYIHIKSIDNQGNVGSTVHKVIELPNLTSTAIPDQNYIKLDWDIGQTNQPYTYKVFQKKEGSTNFQSISATSTKSTVKVLNIYPGYSQTTPIPTQTFATSDGNTYTLPQSALIKMWMESSNVDSSNGYGKGIIKVDPVLVDDFNANPNKYLYDSNGNYKYDVIFQGMWDSYGYQSLNSVANSEISKYISTGRGFLQGHDVATANGILFGGGQNSTAVSSTRVKVTKKGLLTNYPWNVGEINTILSTPYSHDSGLYTNGDVWLKYDAYTDPTYGINSSWRGPAYEDSNGTTNYYLVSKNNVAMIQTGHSNGQATPDEQKLLANTLFYLAQITTSTNLDDHSGQDLKAPTVPVINSAKVVDYGSNIQVKFNPSTDQGSTYNYYVQATGQNTNEVLYSNQTSSTITSGIKGYSIVVDNTPNTIPDNVIDTTSTDMKVSKPNGTELYVHVKAIDNVNNISDTATFKVSDFTPPTLTLSAQTSWTNGAITILATATDNDSGVQYIQLPNGNIVSGGSATYTVGENGVYYFTAVDNMGNLTTSYVVVDRIDKEKPTVTVTNNQNWTNASGVNVNISATDK